MTTAATFKAGTRIEVACRYNGTWEPATIRKWREAVNGPLMVGWSIVEFATGGRLCIHESNFRVTDNRP